MKNTTRIARALACAALLAAPAMAMADDTATIRAEGPDGTVLPERAANVPTGGTSTLVDPDQPDASHTVTVPNDHATSFLLRAAQDAGVTVGFKVYNFGSPSAMITRIGPEASPLDWSWSWAIKVNHTMAQVGSDDVVIHPGDQILWMPSAWGVVAPELDVTVTTARVAAGTPLAVHVDAYDDNGGRTPAAGATVTAGDQSATTDSDGNAGLAAPTGWADVVATAPGSIRDETRACGFPADQPESCGLDPISRRLADVAPNQNLSSVPTNKLTITTSSGKTIDVELPTPTRGGAPVTITADDLDPSLTPSERREVMRRLASSLAWQLNDRAANGEQAVAPPTGTRWRGAWLGRTTTVAPLAQGEAVVSQRTQSVATLASSRQSAQQADERLAACGLDTHAVAVKRFGYAMVIVKAPAAGARACLARRGS